MPRIARNNFETSFFHVICQGVNREFIFYKDDYKDKYIYFLNKYKNEYNISILAYCVMSNHAHILIYVEKIEKMAEFMHKVNGLYAQYYNKNEKRVGVTFRNRYVSEPIYEEKYLVNCIRYIHNNPVKAGIVKKCEEYKYSTSIEYANNTWIKQNSILLKIFDKGYLECLNKSDEKIIFKDIDIDKNELLENGIKMFEDIKKENIEYILNNRESFKELIKYLKENCKIPYSKIAKRFDMTRGKINYLKK